MQIYFIRHAQSENNHLFDLNGSSQGRNDDPDLTVVGEKQARLLFEYFVNNHSQVKIIKDDLNLSGYSFTHLYTSPMIRAIKTAWRIARNLELPLQVIMDIHEGGGIFLENEEKELVGLPGKPKSYFMKNFPGLLLDQEMDETGWWNRPFEPYEIRKPRAKKVIQYLLENHNDNDQIALFSHAGFFNYFLSALLNYDESERVRFNINNTSISRIDIEKSSNITKILYINQISFLPNELIT